MDFNYTKIKFGNWLFQNSFPLYNFLYRRFKNKNDRDEIALLKKLIRPGDHVLDIGANIGYYARLLSRFCGEHGRIYCFEPDSVNFKYLSRNTAKLPNVRLFHKAVSDKAGVLNVYRSKLLNVDHRTYPVNNYDSIEQVEAVTIDQLVTEGVISNVDLIKIDIQGYELAAFKGMERLLSAPASNIRILAEYWPHGFRRAGYSAVAFYDFFDALGYHFSVIEKNALGKLSREFVILHKDEPFEYSFNVLIEKKQK